MGPDTQQRFITDPHLSPDLGLLQVLSWLDVPDLLSSAALVSHRWAAAAACKEVFRRRMHPALLDGLFCAAAPTTPALQQQQPLIAVGASDDAPPSNAAAPAAVSSTGGSSDGGHQLLVVQLLPASSREAAAAALARAGMTPARLFSALYGGNLLCNGNFLERANVAKNADGTRHIAWVRRCAGALRVLFFHMLLCHVFVARSCKARVDSQTLFFFVSAGAAPTSQHARVHPFDVFSSFQRHPTFQRTTRT